MRRQRETETERQVEGASSRSGGGEKGGRGVTRGVRLMSRHLLTTAAGKEAAEELKPAV